MGQNSRIRVVLAFAALYILWGSTYLAIRIAVETLPSFFAAGVRFLLAGAALYAWSRIAGIAAPSGREWRNLWILGVLMFLVPYGALFWAEKTVPSGIASVLLATIPVWTSLLEIFVLRAYRLQWTMVAAMGLGLGGVTVIAFDQAYGSANLLPCLAITAGVITWSVGTICSIRMQLPSSKMLNAGGQMLTGSLLLLVCSAAAGEMIPFPRISGRAALAILYLVVAGSILAYTAFVWLLGVLPATKVSSYAYVNPVVALAIGYFVAGEAIGIRDLEASMVVLCGVALLLTSKSNLHPLSSKAAA